MSKCDFAYDRISRLWICPECSKPASSVSQCRKKLCRKPPIRNCPAKRTPEQIAAAEADRERQESLALEAGAKLGWKPEHAKRWASALLRWRAAGYPTRTDSEVAAIVAICESCDQYAADEGRCSICGCKVSTSGMAVFNKARMGSESCPKGKW